MSNEELEQKWPELKSRIKKEYPMIADELLVHEIGKEGELLERLQKVLGKNKKEMDNWLSIMG